MMMKIFRSFFQPKKFVAIKFDSRSNLIRSWYTNLLFYFICCCCCSVLFTVISKMTGYLLLLLLLVISLLFGRRFFVYFLTALSQPPQEPTLSKLVIKPVLLTPHAVIPAFCRGLVEKLFSENKQVLDESVEEYWVVGCSSSDWEQALREI